MTAQLCISSDTKQWFMQWFCNADNDSVSLKDGDHQFFSSPSELVAFLRAEKIKCKRSSKLSLWPPVFWKRKKNCLFLTFKQMITQSGIYFRAPLWPFLFKVKDSTAWATLPCLWCLCLTCYDLRNSIRNAWVEIKAHISKSHSMLY